MTEYVVPVVAGIVVSLINKYILNNRALETRCEPETEEAEHASNVSDNSDASDALGRASALTRSTLTPPHPVHYHHTHIAKLSRGNSSVSCSGKTFFEIR